MDDNYFSYHLKHIGIKYLFIYIHFNWKIRFHFGVDVYN